MTDRPRRAAPSHRLAHLAVGVSRDGVRTPVQRAALARLALFVLKAEKARNAMLSITLVSARAIAGLNDAYLGHAGPTDVIAFGLRTPAVDTRDTVVGDVLFGKCVV